MQRKNGSEEVVNKFSGLSVIGAMVSVLFGSALAATPPLKTDRAEVMKFFAENVYGVDPDMTGFAKTCKVRDGGFDSKLNACRRDVTLNVRTPIGDRMFTTLLLLPAAKKGTKVPCFVYLDFCRPEEHLGYPVTIEGEKKVWPVDTGTWPVRDILARGYAAASFYYCDAFPDESKEIKDFGRSLTRPANGCGAINVWAMASSRVMDYLETAPDIDAGKVALVGLSRLGKTSLWACAKDTRFAYAVVNGSGCLGARATTRNVQGESIGAIVGNFPHWFAPNCRQFVGRDADLPFDQHWLVAMLAPRLVSIGSAEDDCWACPSGEHASYDLARPAWGEQRNRAHYHIRCGGHDILPEDWADYMDFARRHGW